MKTNVNLKFKMGAALMVMGLGLAGAVNTAQAKDVVLKEIPKKFYGNWAGSESNGSTPAPFTISRGGIGMDDSCIRIIKLIADSANANKLTVVYRDAGLDCDIPRPPIEKTVYLLKNGALTQTINGKTWGPYHRVKW